MPGDSQAIYQGSWLLLRSSGAVFAGAPSILARYLSGSMVHLSFVMSRQWPFCFSSYLSKGSRLSLLVTVHQRPQCFLSAWLPFCFICGIPFSPSILVFGSGDSGSFALLPTLFSGACTASTCLGFVQGVDLSSLTCL